MVRLSQKRNAGSEECKKRLSSSLLCMVLFLFSFFVLFCLLFLTSWLYVLVFQCVMNVSNWRCSFSKPPAEVDDDLKKNDDKTTPTVHFCYVQTNPEIARTCRVAGAKEKVCSTDLFTDDR